MCSGGFGVKWVNEAYFGDWIQVTEWTLGIVEYTVVSRVLRSSCLCVAVHSLSHLSPAVCIPARRTELIQQI
jgi:hypothetical protein